MSGRRVRRERAAIARTVKAMLGRMIVELRAVLRRDAPGHYARHPGTPRPCHTCAFNPATDRWRGADQTAFNFMDALLDGKPFFCHEPLPKDAEGGWRVPIERLDLAGWMQGDVMPPCAGWWIVKDSPDARRAVVRAAYAANGDGDLPADTSTATLDRLADALAELRAGRCSGVARPPSVL